MQMDYFDYKSDLNPPKGSLLVSEPFLPDPNFERTVVLLCENNEEGSFGFILNKKSMLKFSDVIEDADGFEEPLFIGGPVQPDTLHFIHRAGNLLEGAVQISEDLFWGGNFEQLMSLINTKVINPKDFKFFIGYSGWGEGQLNDEISEKSWITYPSATATQIFDENEETLWKSVLKSMGGRFRMFSNYPSDPRLN